MACSNLMLLCVLLNAVCLMTVSLWMERKMMMMLLMMMLMMNLGVLVP